LHLEESVLIQRTPEEVWAYLSDVSNVSSWDRGVAGVQTTSQVPPGVGFEFDTLGHPGRKGDEGIKAKMSYRITKANPTDGCTVQLTNSDGNARYFKAAEWRFRVEPVAQAARVFCAAHFKLKPAYIFLAPFLYLMKKGIRSDLESLKHALEEGTELGLSGT
jgi:Polyketide cyclase / dehydrase and lipid transport